jgi:hypothetical protein
MTNEERDRILKEVIDEFRGDIENVVWTFPMRVVAKFTDEQLTGDPVAVTETVFGAINDAATSLAAPVVDWSILANDLMQGQKIMKLLLADERMMYTTQPEIIARAIGEPALFAGYSHWTD